jgi:hypothetical protein
MNHLRKIRQSGSIILGLTLFLFWILPSVSIVKAQQSTPIVPTVTGTMISSWAEVIVEDQNQINVRSGPNTTYPMVGVLLKGQKVPALGRTPASEWILIAYPGVTGGTAWVFSLYVQVTGKELPIVQPPPEPTPQYTPTLDPTLAAKFLVTSESYRLPTFTAPPPLTIPTLVNPGAVSIVDRIPMGLIIIIITAAGLFLGLFTIVQGR